MLRDNKENGNEPSNETIQRELGSRDLSVTLSVQWEWSRDWEGELSLFRIYGASQVDPSGLVS